MFTIVSDDDGHQYVIPCEMRAEWDQLIKDGDVDLPAWADRVEGGLTFSEYKIGCDV